MVVREDGEKNENNEWNKKQKKNMIYALSVNNIAQIHDDY